jgi:hypothetical protein
VAARAVFIVALVVYVVSVGESPYWLDSSELAAASFGLGIAHPPGHPLAALLGKLATMLPLGSVAMRLGFLSALMGALAAAQVCLLTRDLGRRLRADSDGSVAGLVAGLVFAGTYAAAFSSVRAEVYALSSALTLAALRGILIFDENGKPEELRKAAIWAGLAGGNHPLLAANVVGPALLVLFLRRRKLRTVAVAFGLGLLTFAVLAYLPLRAARHPLVDWGAPLTASRFFWLVSARAFAGAVERGGVGELGDLVGAVAVQLRGIGVPAAALGAWLLWRRARLVAVALVGIVIVAIGVRAAVVFDWGNPDAWAYFSDGIAVCLALACAPLIVLDGAGWRRAVAAILVVAALASGALEWPRWRLGSDGSLPHIVGGWLDRQAPSARVATSYFETAFATWYLQGVEGRRPDVDVFDRHFLRFPGYRDEVLRRRPELAAAVALADPALRVEYEVDLDDHWARDPRVFSVEPCDGAGRSARYCAWQRVLAAHRACRVGSDAELKAAVASAATLVGESPALAGLLRRDCQALGK